MDQISLLKPPDWSLFIGEAGRFLVLTSVALFSLSFLAGAFGKVAPRWQKAASITFILGCTTLLLTFVCLASLFAFNRLEYQYVWKHSDNETALAYRIAGLWAGQEGSFLLWAAAAAMFGIIAMRGAEKYRRWFTATYALFLAAVSGILAYESPFVLNLSQGRPVVPADGLGLAPALQNYWVLIHPPTIFLGFGSLTVLFAYAVAAMIEKDLDHWILIVRPWASVALGLLGLGLCMGGFWAYETLGWGGFWMWDPVENVSFVPWCLTAAFVHGLNVQTSRHRWKFSNLMLAGLPFVAFVYGTFLTRSGLLADASVHSFAEMDASALKLLVTLMGGATLGFFALWAKTLFQAKETAPAVDATGIFQREGFVRTGVWLLVGLAISTLIGMSVPLLKVITGSKSAVVEEHTYHLVLSWMFVPLMIILALTPFVTWRGIGIRELGARFYTMFCVVFALLGAMLLAIAVTPFSRIANLGSTVGFPAGLEVPGLPWIMFLVGICLLAIVSACWRMIELRVGKKIHFAPHLTHVGFAILMIGLIVSRGLERQGEATVVAGHPGRVMNYEVVYKGQTSTRYDRSNKAIFNIYDMSGSLKTPLFVATPGLYYVPADANSDEESAQVWPFIQRFLFHDVYISMRPPQSELAQSVTLKLGETQFIAGFAVTYLGPSEEGMGEGMKLGARLRVAAHGPSRQIVPMMEMASGGKLLQHPANLDSQVLVSVQSFDAAAHTVTLQPALASPIFSIQIFNKPLTGLVWLGTFLMTLGAFLTAVLRRRVAPTPVAHPRREKEPTHEVGPAVSVPVPSLRR